jgi:hypothetical protein
MTKQLMNKIKQLEKLNINLINSDDDLLYKYNKAKADYINNYPEKIILKGFFFKHFEFVKQPDVAEKMWDERFPKNVEDWKTFHGNDSLNSYGEQELINKINEIIGFLKQKEGKVLLNDKKRKKLRKSSK